MKAIIELSRWKEHVSFTLPLTVLGAIIAISGGGSFSPKLLYIIIANILTVSYAFMINDIEDAPDDKRDKAKAKRNPVSAGRIDRENAYTAVRILAIIAILFYALTNRTTLAIGIVTLILSHLYSWKRVRLKAYPIVDIVSHSLMLSGLLILTGFTSFSMEVRTIWAVTAAAILLSVYGQLYNQIRDYEVDRKAKLKNTTILLGKNGANFLKNASVLLAVVALLTSIFYHTFPFWLVVPLFVSMPIIFSFKTKNDSSGTTAIDLGGSMQLQLLLIFNVIILCWLLQIYLS